MTPKPRPRSRSPRAGRFELPNWGDLPLRNEQPPKQPVPNWETSSGRKKPSKPRPVQYGDDDDEDDEA